MADDVTMERLYALAEAQKAEIARLRSELGQALTLLREVEWSLVRTTLVNSIIGSANCCPVCKMMEPVHAKDCRLHAMLDRYQ